LRKLHGGGPATTGKSFRKVVWKAGQETCARLHEEAFRTGGGSVVYVVIDKHPLQSWIYGFAFQSQHAGDS
jgi:hypothetical protein